MNFMMRRPITIIADIDFLSMIINEIRQLAADELKHTMKQQTQLMQRHNKALAEMGIYYNDTFLAKRRELGIKVLDLKIEVLKAVADED